jgi:hypothetical protein
MINRLGVFTRPMIGQHMLAIVATISLFAVAYYIRRDPADLTNIEISAQVKPGGMIKELAEIDRKRNDCNSAVTAEIVDGQTILFKLKTQDLPPAVYRGPSLIYREYPVPFAAAWGRAQLLTQRTYFCWPFYSWWPIYQDQLRLSFEIVPP